VSFLMSETIVRFGRDRHTLGEEGTHLPVTWTERRMLPGRPRLASHADEEAVSPAGSTNGSASIRTSCPGRGFADRRHSRQKPSVISFLLVLVSALPHFPQNSNPPPVIRTCVLFMASPSLLRIYQ
jgi:hypothetical protein